MLLNDEGFIEAVRARTPLRRMGEVEEVSSMVAFLCLHAASYITGQVPVIDGGATINAFCRTHDWKHDRRRNMAFIAIGRTLLG
ncbi:hypothetical protein AAC387_Pa07g0433 [Persea americana]